MTGELRHGTWWDQWRTGDRLTATDELDGRFTRLFDRVASGVSRPSEDDLKALARAMTAPPEGKPTPQGEVDAEENTGTAEQPGIPAGYTYFGQFIDHDLTLDPTSNLHGRPLSVSELADLIDFRTPRLDLDCLYGRGPSDQPYLYEADGVRLLLGAPMSGNPHDRHTVDVPRGPNGRALIGDPRNDENRIVSQLQATMLRFHNAMVARMRAKRRATGIDGDVPLSDVQDQVRWHYQWVVVNDFLPAIIQSAVLAEVFPHTAAAPDGSADHTPRFKIPALVRPLRQMPVEFSVAAYRFGHSMIRPIYRINESIERRQIFSRSKDLAGDLGGMRPIPQDWALDWQYFIDIDHHGHHAASGNDPQHRTPQFSYKIDSSLVNPLTDLPAVIAANPSSLPERNLLRGHVFDLPSGQAVATALGIPPLTGEQLIIGKATGDPADPQKPLRAVAPSLQAFTPLWAYILIEAAATSWAAHRDIADKKTIPVRLGPVGGHIVAETIGALLLADPDSYLHHPDDFQPESELLRNGRFGLAELINTAIHHKP